MLACKHNGNANKVAETLKRERKTMSSMWTALSDLDYYAQFNPEPPEEEEREPEPLDVDEDPFEVPLIAPTAAEVSRA